MKKIIQLCAVLVVLLTLGSCKKYLDIEPVGRVIPKTESDFRALLTSAYAGFAEHKSYLAVRTDELALNEAGYDLALYRDVYNWNDAAADPATRAFPYLAFYNTIFFANEVIAEVQDKAGVSAATDQMKGEAYLLRAYSHFELLNLYAKPYQAATAGTDRGVPLSLKMDLEQKFVPATVEAVYNQVMADINEGQKLLNVATFEAGKNYRFTTRAALALKARVYEFKGDWTNSLAAAQQALALNNQLEDLNVAGSKLPNQYQAKENIMSMEKTLNVSVSQSFFISAHLLNTYNQANDLRFPIYFSKSSKGYVSVKTGNNELVISFRNGELYLVQAEAALQTGNTALATESLLALKAKRLKPAYFATEKTRIQALAKADLLNEIYAERERELALEGHRWYDLRRYGQPAITHTINGTDYILKQNDTRYTLPFPKDAIVNNPDLL
ncbi:RagB/SusD family nutrient uptake outer membrane protein [Pedobacter cryoconitis]|uniref:SusD-like starch-binding protein associating with outer membrane n=1 Tax=Pedobacter cryoconitis TaxID=188932 RepID=A0A327SSN8_9SPHI|nr:RagB/SusD family nutrient uptake outer membrane protein [Pedobacter cryoconitis]RAJ31888.1 SusD-like starch-binding protein associating with outer membrane [Pedobacter cryoconitis]